MTLNRNTDPAGVRGRQASAPAVAANFAQMMRWGAYNLLKVVQPGPTRTTVTGYITTLLALSDKTPRQMEALLGLRINDLILGADIYRLNQLPDPEKFQPRGYTTLVDGLPLGDGLTQDSAGYRPGQGAWQVTLTQPIAATLIAKLGPDDVFRPGLHPDILARYGRRP